MPFMFEGLEVCQKAVDFADRIGAIPGNLPRGHGFLAEQPNRAALSIGTNVAEGNFALPFLSIISLCHNYLWRYERECQILGRRGGGSG